MDDVLLAAEDVLLATEDVLLAAEEALLATEDVLLAAADELLATVSNAVLAVDAVDAVDAVPKDGFALTHACFNVRNMPAHPLHACANAASASPFLPDSTPIRSTISSRNG